MLENTLLVPRIQADTLNMHPIAVIVVITIGSQYFGLWGVILGPPLVALAKDVVIYLVKEWNVAPGRGNRLRSGDGRAGATVSGDSGGWRRRRLREALKTDDKLW